MNENYPADVFICRHSYLQHFQLLRPLIQNLLYHVWKKQKTKIYNMIVMSAKFYSEKLFIHIVFSRIDLYAVILDIYRTMLFFIHIFNIYFWYLKHLQILVIFTFSKKKFLPVAYLCNKIHMDNIVTCFEILDNIFAISVR